MKKKLRGLRFFCLFFLLANVFVHAQTRTIKGVIKDSKTNETIVGATVLVEGTTNGTATDMNGAYTLQVDQNSKFLLVSFLGMVTKKVEITGDVVNVSLDPDAVLLIETVVTALGVSREKKSLGYATQEIKGDAIKDAREVNVINSLAGKVAGLNITSASGAVGASSQIQLRGQTSFKANNAPLFVINGVPIDNQGTSPNDGGTYGSNSRDGSPSYGNPASDINPDDIESINVLKGPIAASLYGSRAQNGAIIITTKSGKGIKGKDFQVTFNSGYSVDNVLRLPSFQNKYGQGYWGDDPTKSEDYMQADESWGAPLDGREYTDYRGTRQKWVPQPNNIKNFFVTGHQFDNAFSLSSADDKGSMRFSFSTFNQTGTVPNTAFNKYTAGINIERQLTKRLKAEAVVNYTLNNGNNRPGVGYDTYNPLQSLFGWFGRQLDMNYLKEHYNDIDPATGLHYNWNFYHNNPYWTLYNNTNKDVRNRVMSTLKLDYKINSWLTASVRGGSDFYVENRFQKFKTGTIDYAIMQKGGLYDDNSKVSTNNIDAVLLANKKLSENFSITGTFGYNFYQKNYKSYNTEVRGLVVPDLYVVTNALSRPLTSTFLSKKEILGIYGMASLGYKGYLYLDVAARNDKSSTVSKSYFYPSVSTSFVFSELLKQQWLSFGKIRLGYAGTGNDTDPYNLVSIKETGEIGADPSITGNPFNDVPYYTEQNTLKNKDLRPEKSRSFEVGTDIKLFNSRLGFDITYYNTKSSDIIVPVSVPTSSGYSSKILNAGSILNQGIELMMTATPVQFQNGFSWDAVVNFSKNNSKILEIAEGLDKILLYRDRAYLYLVKGDPYGTLYGGTWLKDSKGNYLVNPEGNLIKDPKLAAMGTPQPKFRMSFDNTFNYKDLSLSFLVDWKQGGKIYSQTNMWMDYSGLSDRTENRDSLAMEGVQAINNNGNWEATDNVNTVKVSPADYWHDKGFDISRYAYDASYIKLRQIRIGYKFPTKLIEKIKLTKLELGVYARNVLILYSNLPYFDPEVNSAGNPNASGFESNAIPSTRSFGVNLKVVF